MQLIPDTALCTFVFGGAPQLSRQVKVGPHTLSLTSATRLLLAQTDDRAVAVLGVCVDAHGEIEESNIAEHLLSRFNGITALVSESNRLAGKFVVIGWDGVHVYALTDAISAFSVYYYTGDAVLFSSLELPIARRFDLSESETAKDIARRCERNMPMPGDATRYDQIKYLLPNHYLDASARKAVRFYPDGGDFASLSAQEAAEKTLSLSRNIVKGYRAHGDFLCPLTGGWDSRLMLALLLDGCVDVRCYTTRHSEFTDLSDDVRIPRELAALLGFPYQIIDDVAASDELTSQLRQVFGHAAGANTIATHNALFQPRIRVGGDIIDQLGKSALGGTLPDFLGTKGYFQCKLHNYSQYTGPELARWLEDAKQRPGGLSIFDLFAWESRCGRWATRVQNVYALMGLPELNLFNCREILLMWVRVPRRERTHKKLHEHLFQALDPRMLEIPFNPSSKASFVKRHPVLLYFATYVKHAIKGLSH